MLSMISGFIIAVQRTGALPCRGLLTARSILFFIQVFVISFLYHIRYIYLLGRCKAEISHDTAIDRVGELVLVIPQLYGV